MWPIGLRVKSDERIGTRLQKCKLYQKRQTAWIGFQFEPTYGHPKAVINTITTYMLSQVGGFPNEPVIEDLVGPTALPFAWIFLSSSEPWLRTPAVVSLHRSGCCGCTRLLALTYVEMCWSAPVPVAGRPATNPAWQPKKICCSSGRARRLGWQRHSSPPLSVCHRGLP